MYRFQSQLRRLPVPKLQDTIAKAVAYASCMQSYNPEEVDSLRRAMEEVDIGDVQARLEAFVEAAPTGNWLEPLWDDGYLAWQGMLPIDMNYFLEANIEDMPHLSAASQADVAAEVCRASLSHYIRIQQGELPCSKDGQGPLDMSQHARVFGHARVPDPGGEEDTAYCFATKPAALDEPGAGGNHYKTQFVPVEGARRVAVLRHGHVFLVDLTDESGREFNEQLHASLAFIASDSWMTEAAVCSKLPQHNMGMLTASGRQVRMAAREALKARSDEWKDMLHGINSSLFVLCLDGSQPDNESELLARFIHGSKDASAQRWFEKHSVIVSPAPRTTPGNGHRVGMLFEHMSGDGMTTLDWVTAVKEHLGGLDVAKLASRAVSASDKASLLGSGRSTVGIECTMAPGDALHACLEVGARELHRRMDDMSCAALRIDNAGAETFKQSGLPPDAAFQLAMQMAQLAGNGRWCGTYESCATNRFLHGRTEVIRGCSSAAQAAVAAITAHQRDGSASSDTAKQAATEACRVHQAFSREAKEGLGIDRHMTGLKHILATQGDIDEEVRGRMMAFLSHPSMAEACTWDLSTSNCGSTNTSFFGFGPVTAVGTGVGYFLNKQGIRATVTSFGGASADEFAGLVQASVTALIDLHADQRQ
jgi:hypothetical protein